MSNQNSESRTALRVVVPPCDCCGAGADEQCATDCAERVEFEPGERDILADDIAAERAAVESEREALEQSHEERIGGAFKALVAKAVRQ